MPYEHHIFFDHEDLDLSSQEAILREAKELSYEWWVDILDPKVSLQRRSIEMPFDEMMSKFSNKAHFVIIHRKGSAPEDYHIEIGFAAGSDPDYFLFIHVQESHLPYLINKYSLKPIQV